MHIRLNILFSFTLLLLLFFCSPPLRKNIKKNPQKINTENNSNTETNNINIPEENTDTDFEKETEKAPNVLEYIAELYSDKQKIQIIPNSKINFSGYKKALFLLPRPYRLSFTQNKAKTVSKNKIKLLNRINKYSDFENIKQNKFYIVCYFKSKNKKKYKIFPLKFKHKGKKYLLNQIYLENGKIAVEGISNKFYYFNLLEQEEFRNFIKK